VICPHLPFSHFVHSWCPGFDPLGFKPADAASFNQIATKELNNGRLAMLAAAGLIAQELASGKEVFVSLGLAPDTFDPSSLPVQF
jgi:Chlorophyll A-B binding protein